MIDPLDIATKENARVTSTAPEKKFGAPEINAIVSTINELVALSNVRSEYGGIFICEGTGTQDIVTNGSIIIDQWNQEQPSSDGIVSSDGQRLQLVPGIWDIRFVVSYETSARNGEVFRLRSVSNGDVIPGICTRVQHQHPGTTVYNAIAGRLVEFSAPKDIAVQVVAESLNSTRTFAVRHATFTAKRLS